MIEPIKKRYPNKVSQQPSLFETAAERVKIVNCKSASKEERDTAVYVGRANASYKLRQSPLHNPFKGGDRATIISQYREHLLRSLKEDPTTAQAFAELLGRLKQEGSLTLMCWCAPKPCHAEVIKELLEGEIN